MDIFKGVETVPVDRERFMIFNRKCLSKSLVFGSIDDIHSVAENQGLRVYVKESNFSTFTKTYLSANSAGEIYSSQSEDDNSEITVILPQELAAKAKEQHNDFSRIVFAVIDNLTLFEFEDDRSILNRKVVGVIVGNTSIENITEPVTINIEHDETLQDNSFHQCVFWLDVDDESTPGHWDPAGCQTETRNNQTICYCHHLSFFAVLLDFQRKDMALHEEVLVSLTYITQIGCGISAIFSALNVILYFVYRNFKSDHATVIHINLSAALFLLNMTFMINVWATSSSSDGVCKLLAVCMHYSLLCSFTWMAIEAFHLYIMLIKVFNSYIRGYILKLALVGWVKCKHGYLFNGNHFVSSTAMPAVVVILCVSTKKDNYGQYVIQSQNNSSSTSVCWITTNIVHYVTNGAYFTVIWLCNTIIFVTVCIMLVQMKNVQRNWNEKGNAWKDIWLTLGLSCLLGTTWALAFLQFGPLHIATLYLFTIFNSLQG
ncbi:adhesion G-protein coupled receptor G2-like [Callorhinchus milii]|uniref:adhesion G-protein coupled receptor G2-like n=1 Tax=Callorhinchus milii TaxID=7868 RepID=UPI001C3FC18C|nr:adhesion G-protein coupled receptor G2-like [Callorhinchus milii]